MNSREQGYEDDRFENVVSQNFYCPICLNVFKDPMTCQRNQHYFCRPCITRHLQNSQRCPSCQEELTLETLSKAPRIVTNYLSELKIRCDYFRRGCGDFVQLGDLERHVKDCGFTPVLCSNEGCVVEMNKRDRTHHETEVCEFRKVKCHDCSEIRKEVDEVKVNLNEVKVSLNEVKVNLNEVKINLKAVNEKLDKIEEFQETFEQLATLPAHIRKMKEDIMKDFGEVKDKLNGMEASKHQLDQQAALSADIQTKKEDRRRTNNDINNLKPSVVVAGGWSSRSVEMFDWAKETWSPLQPMKECRLGASSFVYKDQLTVTGGSTGFKLTDNMERMEINPNMHSTQWFDFPAKLPNTLHAHSTCSVVYNERLITIGGYEGSAYSDSIHEVRLVQPYTRNLLSTMPQQSCFHGAQLFDDKVFIVGGTQNGNCKGSTASVLMYDINKKECKQMAPLPFAVCQMATVRWGDNVIVIGGADQDDKTLNTVVIYNVQTGKSHMLPEMKCKRKMCTAVVSQGVIVVMGGCDERGRSLNSVECFTFDRYSWEDLPPMNEARYGAVGW